MCAQQHRHGSVLFGDDPGIPYAVRVVPVRGWFLSREGYGCNDVHAAGVVRDIYGFDTEFDSDVCGADESWVRA